MSGSAANLPTPRPDDDEDVVWGLSTASALWARGERRDAIVWIRRAIDAANGAGQAGRASELDGAAAALEKALAEPPAADAAVDDDAETIAEEPAAVRAAVDAALQRNEPAAPPAPAPSPSVPAGVRTPVPPSRRTPEPVIPRTAAPPAITPAPPAATPPAPPAAPSAPPFAQASSFAPPAATTRLLRQRPRAPLLDPWSETTTYVPIERPADAAAPEPEADDEDVITSAVPLAVALRRRSPARGAKAPVLEVVVPVATDPPPPVDAAPAAFTAPATPVPPAPPADATDEPPTPPRALSRPVPAPAALPVPPPAPSGDAAPTIGGLPFEAVPVLAGVPAEVKALLASSARIEVLAPGAELAGFEAALVVSGAGALSASTARGSVQPLSAGALVPSRGSLAEGVSLRLIAGAAGARAAIWTGGAFDTALRWCPWVLDELEARANRLQALAGASAGSLGDVDEAARAGLADRLRVRALRPGEVAVEQGAPLAGTTILGAGRLEIEGRGEAHPGDVLFPRAASTGAPAPCTARAASTGALLLVGDSALLAELSARSPALRDLLAH
jgi:hypothetical protein